MTKARPTMAGLKMLQPNPPNTTLPSPIATAEPITATYHGDRQWSESPKITPVTTADQSPIGTGLRRIRVNTASAARQLSTHSPT